MDRKELIKKLLSTFHLNVNERKLLNPSYIEFKELTSAIEIILQEEGFFPVQAKPDKSSGGAFYEGAYIEKIDNEFSNLIWSRNHPLNPCKIAERNEEKLATKETIKKIIVSFGSEFDGIKIMQN
ncbi:MAG: hypothetical protein HQK52_16915 [Oligoflexia bacterium]|nr:hypothetical protein [Oligoflexia bacterium]